MLPKTRLGKRSPLGALLSATCPTHTHLETGETDVTMATAAGQQASSRSRVHPGLKVRKTLPGVYFQCAGEPSGVDQIDGPLSSPSCRSVSSCIDVPKRSVDMDELMAAMVLSSLSCSPLLQSPTHPDTTGNGSSGYWSVGHAPSSPMPSPPIAEPDAGVVPPTDEGLDMELEQVLFDEPAPRKRRNSVKAAFRCLWPSCGKVLTSVVGIKRHIRTTHLCRGGEHERCSRSEEDFYYTEINQWEQPLCQSPPTPLLCGPSVLVSAKTNHKHLLLLLQGVSFRVRSVSVGEQWLQHHSAPCRLVLLSHCCILRVRGEAKKCRKVYGIEHREQWCTACRWKKACQRFTD
uniref:Zinc finger protein 395-like n=1 Tax=Acanthochromis polyacanthus TaxID=80966 RepID=A0A3Q1EG15_9TELE